jgi:endonuclease/exonuclease/phosphatase family metal-dependent hydrolase
MGQSKRFLNTSTLNELHLSGCLFTQSNQSTHPTLERIDRAFVSNEWEALFPDYDLHALATCCSDHVPLLLCTDDPFNHCQRFHFRSF